ncbi:uncharacterized protein LOC106363976 [Brassica napus]|uniref:uncharacterized protein LOC106363976 n=1 Tax=Brassica napus TaxID=3708 RepID=UPI000BBF3599|nr:uncharacterized protein LOC106363976 [Brassica napus]
MKDICVNLPLITAKPDIEIVVDLLNLLKLEKSAVEKPFNSTNNSSGKGYFNREAFRRIWNIQTWISCTSSSTALNVYKTWINASYSEIMWWILKSKSYTFASATGVRRGSSDLL